MFSDKFINNDQAYFIIGCGTNKDRRSNNKRKNAIVNNLLQTLVILYLLRRGNVRLRKVVFSFHLNSGTINMTMSQGHP